MAHRSVGSQFTSIRGGERLAEIGVVPSIGSGGDSCGKALAETLNGLRKAEPIYGPGQGPWKPVADVEPATLPWVHWPNTRRLHGDLGSAPPTECEEAYDADGSGRLPVENLQKTVSIKPRAVHTGFWVMATSCFRHGIPS